MTSIFNTNDFKQETNIDLEELDQRYVNSEGDTITHLNIKTIQLYDTSTVSFADNTIQTTAYNEDVKNEIYDHVDEIISNSNSLLNNNNTFTGINNFNNEIILKNQVKIYDLNNSNNYVSLYYNNTKNFNIQNIHNTGFIQFMVGNKTMCVINRNQLNMQNNPISNIASIVFSDNTEQNTAFTTNYINTLQTQIDSLNLKTKSLSYIENLEVPDVSPYYEKLTFNSNEIEFTGNVLFSGNTNIITTDLTNVNNNIMNLQQKTEGLFYHNNITTRLDKKLVIRAPMGDGNAGAHLQIINNHVNWVGTTVDTYIFSGCPAGFWSAMTKNRDTVYLNREPGLGVNNGTGGFVFTSHANIKRGLRVDCFGGKSEINCGEFEVNANLNVNGNISINGVNINDTLIGKTQYGRFFDSPLRQQGGNSSEVDYYLSSPDINSVNSMYHADILPAGTSYITGPNYFLRFKSAGVYRLQMAWSITRNYLTSDASVSSWFTPPNYYPTPENPLPGNENNTPTTTTQFNNTEYWVQMTNGLSNTDTENGSFPSIMSIQNQSFSGIEAFIDSILETNILYPFNQGRTYSMKKLRAHNIVERKNRFFLDMTFSLIDTSPKDLYFHIKGFDNNSSIVSRYFHQNNHTYTITRLA